jgi:hypothetical protein
MTPVSLSRYPEPHKVPTNPRWCLYTKGSPHEGQGPRLSNSIESHGPSPRTSGAPLLAPLEFSPLSPLSSFRSKRRGPCVIPGLQRGEVEVILFVLFPHSGDALWEFGICGKYSPVR